MRARHAARRHGAGRCAAAGARPALTRYRQWRSPFPPLHGDWERTARTWLVRLGGARPNLRTQPRVPASGHSVCTWHPACGGSDRGPTRPASGPWRSSRLPPAPGATSRVQPGSDQEDRTGRKAQHPTKPAGEGAQATCDEARGDAWDGRQQLLWLPQQRGLRSGRQEGWEGCCGWRSLRHIHARQRPNEKGSIPDAGGLLACLPARGAERRRWLELPEHEVRSFDTYASQLIVALCGCVLARVLETSAGVA